MTNEELTLLKNLVIDFLLQYAMPKQYQALPASQTDVVVEPLIEVIREKFHEAIMKNQRADSWEASLIEEMDTMHLAFAASINQIKQTSLRASEFLYRLKAVYDFLFILLPSDHICYTTAALDNANVQVYIQQLQENWSNIQQSITGAEYEKYVAVLDENKLIELKHIVRTILIENKESASIFSGILSSEGRSKETIEKTRSLIYIPRIEDRLDNLIKNQTVYNWIILLRSLKETYVFVLSENPTKTQSRFGDALKTVSTILWNMINVFHGDTRSIFDAIKNHKEEVFGFEVKGRLPTRLSQDLGQRVDSLVCYVRQREKEFRKQKSFREKTKGYKERRDSFAESDDEKDMNSTEIQPYLDDAQKSPLAAFAGFFVPGPEEGWDFAPLENNKKEDQRPLPPPP